MLPSAACFLCATPLRTEFCLLDRAAHAAGSRTFNRQPAHTDTPVPEAALAAGTVVVWILSLKVTTCACYLVAASTLFEHSLYRHSSHASLWHWSNALRASPSHIKMVFPSIAGQVLTPLVRQRMHSTANTVWPWLFVLRAQSKGLGDYASG